MARCLYFKGFESALNLSDVLDFAWETLTPLNAAYCTESHLGLMRNKLLWSGSGFIQHISKLFMSFPCFCEMLQLFKMGLNVRKPSFAAERVWPTVVGAHVCLLGQKDPK